MLCQEDIILLDSIEKQNDISFETLEKNEVVNAEILNQVVDISFKNCYDHTLYGFSEDQFDRVLDKLPLEQPGHGKKMTEYFEGCHDACNLVADSMEKP